MNSKRVLGRGLSALIPEGTAVPVSESGVLYVKTDQIRSNPYQPRSVVNDEKLADLADSIRQNGIIQPLVLRRHPEGQGYQLVAGERRLLAAIRAGLSEVPAVIRDASRKELLELALVENLQREDLNPIEESRAYQRLANDFGLTQDEIATKVGKDKSTVANSLRLLTLPTSIQDRISGGDLTAGHARCLLAVSNPRERMALCERILAEHLSVRQAEDLTAGHRRRTRAARRRRGILPELAEWEARLRRQFGTEVHVIGGTARGRVEIHYFNETDLERIMETLARTEPGAAASFGDGAATGRS